MRSFFLSSRRAFSSFARAISLVILVTCSCHRTISFFRFWRSVSFCCKIRSRLVFSLCTLRLVASSLLTCLLNSALTSSFSLIRLLISSCCFLSSWSNATCSSSSSVVCFSIFSFSCCKVFNLSASWSILPSRSSCVVFFCTSSACPCEISTPLAIGDCFRPAEGLFPCNSPPLGSRDITGADGAAKPAFDGGIEARIVGKIVAFS